MQINSALGNALHGINNGMSDLRSHAADIASVKNAKGTDLSGLTAPLVEMQSAQTQVQASAAMMKTVDETLGSLLDEYA
ncbi:MAG TPA: hypothetical protein ENJ19_01615 [Gammaproteobacteria bacterium]|nr:hypothetical protein [Gammaproteobacteria bacterium]